MNLAESLLAALILAVCVVLGVRLCLGPARQQRFDRALRSWGWTLRRGALRLWHWRASRRLARTEAEAVIQRARQGAEAVAMKAGLSSEAVANLSDTMMDKIGDANVIRFMAAIGDMMGDDAAIGIGKGGALTTTPAEARQALAVQRSPEGAYAKAVKADNRAEIARLQPEIDRLTKIAAGG